MQTRRVNDDQRKLSLARTLYAQRANCRQRIHNRCPDTDGLSDRRIVRRGLSEMVRRSLGLLLALAVLIGTAPAALASLTSHHCTMTADSEMSVVARATVSSTQATCPCEHAMPGCASYSCCSTASALVQSLVPAFRERSSSIVPATPIKGMSFSQRPALPPPIAFA